MKTERAVNFSRKFSKPRNFLICARTCLLMMEALWVRNWFNLRPDSIELKIDCKLFQCQKSVSNVNDIRLMVRFFGVRLRRRVCRTNCWITSQYPGPWLSPVNTKVRAGLTRPCALWLLYFRSIASDLTSRSLIDTLARWRLLPCSPKSISGTSRSTETVV